MAADDKTPPGSKASSGSKSGGDSSGVMRVIRKVGGPVNWPLLTRTNYTERALLVNVKMKAWNLWDAVEFGGTGTQEEMLALDTITSAVSMEMVAQLAVKETAKEAWDAVATIRVSSDQVCKAKAQRLRREYEMIRFGPDETIDDFITYLSNLVATWAPSERRSRLARSYGSSCASRPRRSVRSQLLLRSLFTLA